jgi:hypothetical protein
MSSKEGFRNMFNEVGIEAVVSFLRRDLEASCAAWGWVLVS